MSILPKQPLADDEVISYWIEKPKLKVDEIVPLIFGVNPFAYQSKAAEIIDKKEDIEDFFVLINHREIEPIFSVGEPMEFWRDALHGLGVQLPDWLNEYKTKTELKDHKKREALKNIAKNLTPEQKEKNKQKFIDDLDARKKIENEPTLLSEWFAYDNWGKDNAMLLLVGLDPGGTVIKDTADEYLLDGDKVVLEIEVAFNLSCKEMIPRSLIDEYGNEDDRLFYRKLNAEWGFISSVFDSGSHSDKNPPNYYIDWALSKNFQISWLQFAIEKGYYKPENNLSQNIEANSPLKERERNSLLRLIAALHETLLEKVPQENNKPLFKNQSELINYLADKYDGYEGLSKSNLESKFPLAKKSLLP